MSPSKLHSSTAKNEIQSLKAVGYCRVSTEDQAQFGVSLKSQAEKIQQYAALYGFEVTEIITDAGISAKNFNRPGVQRVLSMMKQKAVDAVIVAKLDRLTRSVRDLADIIDLSNKKGIALISVNERIDTGSAAGRMIVNMMGVISQWEREAIGERTKTAIQYKKARGETYSSRYALYGYEKQDGHLVQMPYEQDTISQIMSMKDSLTVADVCRELSSQGIRTRGGSVKWFSKVVRKIILDAPARERIDAIAHEAAHKAA
jgi:DNA invertase Pin-like site-specific DNA recombinase